METDASHQALASILSQYHVVNGCKQLHSVVQHVKNLSATQRNWPVYNKELFTIVDCFLKQREWLVGIKMNVYIDQKRLQYLNTMKKLNSWQPSWYLCMSQCMYHIHYSPGFNMDKPGGLHRASREEKSGIDTVMTNMQTGWEPLAAPISASSYVGCIPLQLASSIYICPACTQFDLQIPSEAQSHQEIS